MSFLPPATTDRSTARWLSGRPIGLLATAAAAVFLHGCAVTPEPLSDAVLAERAERELTRLTADQEPVSGPIDLYEAAARALKYNLDYRLEVMEKALANRTLDVSRYDLLPEITASAGYDGRNEFNAARSVQIDPATRRPGPVTNFVESTSSDRDIKTADIQLSWNILDFGLSYVRAQQEADRVLIAEEQKRKVVHRIMQDVRTAYWRAVSEQRLRDRMAGLRADVERALGQSRETGRRRLSAPLRALTYQRELVDIRRQVEELERDLSIARTQLAALMNLRPGEEYTLAVPQRDETSRDLPMTLAEMEQAALTQRPEMREVGYEQRINAKEARAAVLRLLPGINLYAGGNYDSNDFLFDNDWYSWGARVSWNLLNVARLPATQKLITARGDVLEAREMALAMAVLTQVHVGAAQYGHARKELATASEFYGLQSGILDQVRKGARAQSVSRQNLIREELNGLLAEVRYDVAYADLENAFAGVIESVGGDPLPESVSSDAIADIAAALRERDLTQ